jgi:hypothetical protein
MRKGLILGALLASVFVAGTALADQYGDDENRGKASRGQSIKDRVLEKQREGFAKARMEKASQAARKNLDNRMERVRPKGDVYGDQATRSGQSRMSTASGKNMSASSSVNTPKEINRMIKVINGMHGAYRTCQAVEGTDSYGGGFMTAYNRAQQANGRAKNMSATGATNNPREIRTMMSMFGPGAAAQAGGSPGSTDSYGGGEQPTDLAAFKSGRVGSGFNRAQGEKYSQAQKSRVSERASKVVKATLNDGKDRIEKTSKTGH